MTMWHKTALFCFAVSAMFAWALFTQKLPAEDDLVAVQGTIQSAGWHGRRHGGFVIRLIDDSRLFQTHLDLIWEKVGPPADIAWQRKEAKLVVAKKAMWPSGRTFIYSLELGGQLVYDIDDVQRQYRRERPGFAILATIFVLIGASMWWWQSRRRRIGDRADEVATPKKEFPSARP